MANPIPCGVCQQISDAEFLVTDMTDGFQLLGVPTQGMCVQCFVEKGLALANALQAAYEEMQGQEPAPGVIEAIEQDEGPVTPADPLPAAPKSKKTHRETETAVTVETQAETSGVDA